MTAEIAPGPVLGPGKLFAMEIRPVTVADREAHIDLYEAVAAEGRWIGGEAPVDRDRIGGYVDQAISSDDAAMFVADDGGRIVGSIGLQHERGVVELGMFLDSEHRGAGIGRTLLGAGIGWARSIGAHKVILEVWPHNARAIALYRSDGFAVEGRRVRHYRRRNGELWDAVMMGLVLDHDSPGSTHGAAATV